MESPVHVVVGAGTSAVLLIHELTMRYKHHLIVILDHNHPSTPSIPESPWSFDAFDITKAQLHLSTKQEKLGGRNIIYPVGKGVGGSSNVNAMIYTEPHVELIKEKCWPNSSDWNNETILEYLERVQELIVPSQYKNISQYALGLLLKSDGNNEYDANYSTTMNNDFLARKRLSKIFSECEESGRLTVVTNASALRVLFNEFHEATGVEYKTLNINSDSNTAVAFTKNEGEVILSAGAINSPRVLYDSVYSLDQIDTDFKQQIGKNLQDHLILPYILLGNWSSVLNLADTIYKSNMPVNGVHAVLYMDEQGHFLNTTSQQLPSTQLLIVDGSIALGLSDMLIPQFADNIFYSRWIRPILLMIMKLLGGIWLVKYLVSKYVFGILVCLVQPTSTGEIRLKKSESSSISEIQIEPNFLADENDRIKLFRAFQRARMLVTTRSSPTNRALQCMELLPGWLFNHLSNLRDFQSYLHCFGTTYFHLTSSCSLVVDSELRVRGSISKLRVVDASALPYIPANNPAATCMMLGVAAAKFIAREHANQSSQKNKLG